jgi:molybdopterin converting factor small subunit
MLNFVAMTLQLHAYGIARDIVGARVIDFETPGALTVAELQRLLLERYPAFGDLSSLRVAVNAEFGESDTPLREGDEIVLIPPVSGG